MSTNPLLECRRHIDAIDAQLHALLIERAELSRRIAAIKKIPNGRVFHPERETKMLENRVRAHQGPASLISIIRIWREIISSSYALQGGIRILLPDAERDVARLARNWFGNLAQYEEFSSLKAGAEIPHCDAMVVSRERLESAPESVSEHWRSVVLLPYTEKAQAAVMVPAEQWQQAQGNLLYCADRQLRFCISAPHNGVFLGSYAPANRL